MFKDRIEAGQKLAETLEKYKNAGDVIILGLPRGGVIVAAEISHALNLPLDVVVPRKIGHPSNLEYAIGAITETDEGIFNENELRSVDKKWLAQEIEKEKNEAARRLKLYRGEKPMPDLKNKIVILVDDGIATGYTMLAAIKFVKTQKPKKIIVAVPHGAPDSLVQIEKEVDEVVALEKPEFYTAVGAFYEDFPQVTDEEVIQILISSDH